MGPGISELRALGPGSWQLRALPLAASVVALSAAYFMSAAIWGRIVSDLGGPTLAPRVSVPLFMVANLGRYLPGKVWQIAGLAALASRRGVAVATATAAAVAGQGAALLAATALGTVALLRSPAPYPMWGLVALGLVVTALALASVPAVYARVLGAWFRLARAERPDVMTPTQGLVWLLLTLGSWVVYAGSFWLLAVGLGLDLSPVTAGSSFAAAYVLGYLMVFAPAGLGPREGFLILFLAPQVGAGPAGMVAVAARVWTTLVEVVPAGAFWVAGAAGVRGARRSDG